MNVHGSLLTNAHSREQTHSATARHEHEAQQNANGHRDKLGIYIIYYISPKLFPQLHFYAGCAVFATKILTENPHKKCSISAA